MICGGPPLGCCRQRRIYGDVERLLAAARTERTRRASEYQRSLTRPAIGVSAEPAIQMGAKAGPGFEPALPGDPKTPRDFAV
jgi:hypothetical protein